MRIGTAGALGLIVILYLFSWNIARASAQAQEDYEQPIYKYVGNLFSLKFHRPSCKFARAMWRGNVVRFQYRKQAVDAGQKPCRYCLPPDWKSVGAKILGTETGSVIERANPAVAGSNPVSNPDSSNPTIPEGTLNADGMNGTEAVRKLDPLEIRTAGDESVGIKPKALSAVETNALRTNDYQLPSEPSAADQSPGFITEQQLQMPRGKAGLDTQNSLTGSDAGTATGEVKQADADSVLSD